jgi:hypothetical protein
MEGKIDITIESEEIGYYLKEVIRELCQGEIIQMVKETAKEKVGAEIDKIIEPLVMNTLTNEKFDCTACYSRRDGIDNRIKEAVVKFLDQPCYAYSKTETKPSERFRASVGCKTSRLELFMQYAIEKYMDEHLTARMAQTVKDYLQNKDEIERIAKEQTVEIIRSQLKLNK